MTIEKGLIGVEDIEFGTGTYLRKGKSGQNITLTKVDASSLPIADVGAKFDSTTTEGALQECQVQNGIGSTSKDYTNKSGGSRELGDVVLIDTDNDESFEVTTTANSSLVLGVVSENIAVDVKGQIVAGGYINEVKVIQATARGSYLQTSTTSGQAKSSTTFDEGTFAISLSSTGGAGTVSALVFGSVSGSYLPLVGGVVTGEIVSAGRRLGYVAKSIDYTTVSTDEIIDVTAGAGGVIVTLASIDIANEGKRWIIRNSDGGAGNVTIGTEGSETINGNATVSLTTQYTLTVLYSDGSNVIEDSASLVNQTLTNPTITGGLTFDGSSVPSFSAYMQSDLAIVTGTWTKVPAGVEIFDTNADYDKDTNYRFTPTVAGKYSMNCLIAFSMTGTDIICWVALYKNGALYVTAGNQPTNSSIGTVHLSSLVDANGTTDYFEMYVKHEAGSNRDLQGRNSGKYMEFSGVKAA